MSAAFFTVHDGLEREGPGDRESLGRALALAGVEPEAVVLDAGCGPGADVPGLLAQLPRGRVVAVDLHAPFVARVAAAHAGDPRVTALVADMADPPGGPFGLIWSAGAIYGLGVADALRGWRPHLVPGGRVAFSEACWRVAEPSPVARAFWQAEYPAMTDRAGVLAQVAAAGYRVLGDFWLSRAGWAAYYDPLAARIVALRAGPVDAALEAALAAHEAELAVWRDCGEDYGYLMVVAEPA